MTTLLDIFPTARISNILISMNCTKPVHYAKSFYHILFTALLRHNCTYIFHIFIKHFMWMQLMTATGNHNFSGVTVFILSIVWHLWQVAICTEKQCTCWELDMHDYQQEPSFFHRLLTTRTVVIKDLITRSRYFGHVNSKKVDFSQKNMTFTIYKPIVWHRPS